MGWNTWKLGELGMGFDITRRRTFLSTFAGAFAALSISPGRSFRAAATAGPIVSFFVAGVRFQSTVAGLDAGILVRLIPSEFDGKRSYMVRTMTDELIGYAPRSTVPVLHGLEDRPARLSTANYHAVPWKRFEVTIES